MLLLLGAGWAPSLALSTEAEHRRRLTGASASATSSTTAATTSIGRPSGAVTAGTPVRIRLRVRRWRPQRATLRLADRLDGRRRCALPMERVATDPDGGDFGYDYWEVEVATGPAPVILDYMFVAEDGSTSRHLFDDRANDGGTGEIGRSPIPGRGFQLTAYDPEFETPKWAQGAVAYQVFPDRFANGDPSNRSLARGHARSRWCRAISTRRCLRRPGRGAALGRASGELLPRLRRHRLPRACGLQS